MGIRTVHLGSVEFLFKEGILHKQELEYQILDGFVEKIEQIIGMYPEVEENADFRTQYHGGYELQSENLEQLTKAYDSLRTYANRWNRKIEVGE